MASEVQFNGEISELPKILDWVRNQLELTTLNDSEKKRVELCMEEAVVNVITHSKPPEFHLYCQPESHRIEFQVKDYGPPFNPIDHADDTQSDLSLQDRVPGGLGLSIMRNYMDALLYRREGNQNIFTLIKDVSLHY